ncbi:endonuclease/exonuclease/phosphatase family protein [Filimonas lacunae]|uniref:endonuclease/exonuclease/phosphatase family protein n=1 Tax=Filimonas lacunae TaxID=477680 RepID=UPI0018D53403|nr:endonuclease/exonuclease/phosphatase [Filimonas lacunae]
MVNVAFYNLENLFDTVHAKGKNDFDFLPTGVKKYTPAVYFDKLKNLSTVLRDIGTDVSPDGAAIIGVSEVENRNVLEDLVKQEAIAGRGYKIEHYESPDFRGIDVGLLYNPKYFTVETSFPVPVVLPGSPNDTTPHTTRDILVVKGKLDGEYCYVMVNHWPSRLGGVGAADNRSLAAGIVRRVIDSITRLDAKANIIVMGDLNDSPDNVSVTKVLKAGGKMDKLKEDMLFNPWADFYNRGIGTLAYQDAWALFDQIILSQSWLDKTMPKHFRFYKANIFKRDDMVQTTGRYKGYPKRTYDFDNYMSGFSDHFPTYITLIKPIE